MFGCIEWTGYRDKAGYGWRTVGGKKWPAHRYAYFLEYGSIPDGLVVMHKCDNPSCINVLHLRLGTHRQNMEDMAAKGRSATDLRHGKAKLSDARVAEIRSRTVVKGSRTNGVSALAREYGITPGHMSAILSGRYRMG